MKIGIISDIHANPFGLEAVLTHLYDVDIILCAGDMTGYSPLVNETFEILKSYENIKYIIGNHDYYLINGYKSNVNSIVKKSVFLTKKIIKKEYLEFLKNMKITNFFYLDNLKIKLIHGSPFDPLEGYVYPDYPIDPNKFCLDSENILILGHTHYQMYKKFEKFQIINPGSCGQPRDKSISAGCSILDTQNLKVELFKVNYDVQPIVNILTKEKWPFQLLKPFQKHLIL